MVWTADLAASNAPLKQGDIVNKDLDRGLQDPASIQTATMNSDPHTSLAISNGISASTRKMPDSTDLQSGFGQNVAGIETGGMWSFENVSNLHQPLDAMQPEYFQPFLNDTHLYTGADSLPVLHPSFPSFNNTNNSNNMNIAQLKAQDPNELPPTSSFVKLVEDTCIKYALQLNTIKMIGNSPRRVSDANNLSEQLTALSNRQIPERVTKDLVKIAVYLIAITAKLEKYVYGVVSSALHFEWGLQIMVSPLK
jgi:hypothetical protein